MSPSGGAPVRHIGATHQPDSVRALWDTSDPARGRRCRHDPAVGFTGGLPRTEVCRVPTARGSCPAQVRPFLDAYSRLARTFSRRCVARLHV